MKILVCGGRDYSDKAALFATMNRLVGSNPSDTIIIEGGAPGADSLARQWAEHRGVHCAEVRALWRRYGRPAGNKRNAAMLDLLQPDLCVAFPGGRGTEDMVRKCELKNVPVWRFEKHKPRGPSMGVTL